MQESSIYFKFKKNETIFIEIILSPSKYKMLTQVELF